MRRRLFVVTCVLVVAGLAAWIALSLRSTGHAPQAASTPGRPRSAVSSPSPARSTVSPPATVQRTSPPSPRLRLRYVTTIGGHISPKSVVASGTGLVFAQNMI